MRKTKEATLATKMLIKEKAMDFFLQKGFSETTLDEIAQEANVTRGAIYSQFKGKLDIVNELIETEHQALKKRLSDLFSEDIPPFNKIEKIIKEITIYFFDNRSFQKFIELTWFKIEYNHLARLRTSKAELTSYFISNFKQLIIEAQMAGEIRSDINDYDVAITINNMINGMYRLFFILPDYINNKEEALSSFNSYLKLIKI